MLLHAQLFCMSTAAPKKYFLIKYEYAEDGFYRRRILWLTHSGGAEEAPEGTGKLEVNLR